MSRAVLRRRAAVCGNDRPAARVDHKFAVRRCDIPVFAPALINRAWLCDAPYALPHDVLGCKPEIFAQTRGAKRRRVEFVRPWRRGVFPYSALPRAGRSGAPHTRQPCACFQRLSVGYHARMARRASSASSPGFCCCSKRMQKSIISSIVQSAVKPPF